MFMVQCRLISVIVFLYPTCVINFCAIYFSPLCLTRTHDCLLLNNPETRWEDTDLSRQLSASYFKVLMKFESAQQTAVYIGLKLEICSLKRIRLISAKFWHAVQTELGVCFSQRSCLNKCSRQENSHLLTCCCLLFCFFIRRLLKNYGFRFDLI